MERAIGIGGVFMRAKDPAALARWYREQLGIDTYSEESAGTWWQDAGPTVWAPFPTDTEYFGRSGQGMMINVRVRDLDAMLAQLRAADATIPEDAQEMEGLGKFCWVEDPEGNRVELWQPAPESLVKPESE